MTFPCVNIVLFWKVSYYCCACELLYCCACELLIIVIKYIYNTAEMPNNKWSFLFFAEQYYREIYFIVL